MHVSRDNLISIVIIGCTLLTAMWLAVAHFNRRTDIPYDLTAADFVNFQPMLEGCDITKMPPMSPSSVDANLLGLVIQTPTTSSPPSRFLVRLVLGYSMPMCMKRKSYTVEKVQDHIVRSVSDPKLLSALKMTEGEGRGAKSEEGRAGGGGQGEKSGERMADRQMSHTLSPLPTAPCPLPPALSPLPIPPSYPIPVQIWRLTSGGGEVSYWLTTMIRSGDFEPTKEDICSMPFPRVTYPDDPNWIPRGLNLEDLKRPREVFWDWFNSRWDGACWDVLTFIGLRPRARGNEDLLSYMTLVKVSPSDAHAGAIAEALTWHAAVLNELQKWRGRVETLEPRK